MIILMYIFSIVFLLILSGFFSGSETALFSLKKWHLRQLEIVNESKSLRITKLLSRPRNLLITILVGNLLVNVSASTIAESFCHTYFIGNGSLIAIFSMTVLLLIFGEITPKILAIKYPRRFALNTALPLIVFNNLITPLRNVLYSISAFFMGLVGTESKPESSSLSRHEIPGIMDMSIQEGVMNTREKKIISRISKLSRLRVSDLAIPLDRIFAVEIHETPGVIIRKVINKGYSRIPVYSNDRRNIVGILLMKDLLPVHHGDGKLFKIKEYLHEPVLVRSNQSAIAVLRILRNHKLHMAVVTDKKDQVTGIITIQDFVNILVDDKSE